MINGSDTMPDVIVKSAGKTQIRYDIEESERVEMDESKRTCYSYSYVAIEGELTRDKIIDAIIVDEIGSKDAEIALINNEIASAGTEEYAGYQAWRQKAKAIADEVLG
jgi:hypothetical protein